MDTRVVRAFAAARIQLCRCSRSSQPPSLVGRQASRRSGLEIRVVPMSATPLTVSEISSAAWKLPSRGRVGMLCLIAAEVAIFTIFVVAYLFYLGKNVTGPTPKEVL